jgi:hypothetical protein
MASYGDYDFNDVALNYQVIVKLNPKFSCSNGYNLSCKG